MTYTNEELLELFSKVAMNRPYKLQESSVSNYVIYIKYLLEYLNDKSIFDITTADIESYLDTLGDRADSTYNCRLSGFKKFYHVLYTYRDTRDYLSCDPTDRLVLTPVREREPKVPLTDTEKSILLQYAKRSHNKALYAVLTTLLNTGMRISECLSITIEQYNNRDMNGGMIKLSNTKNHKDREIYLNDDCIRAIDEYLSVRVDGVYLFTSQEGNMIDKCNMNKTIKNVARKSGKFDEDRVAKLSNHLTRVTYSSDLFNDKGLSISQISKILGNSEMVCSSVYVKTNRESTRSAMAM